MQTIWKKQIEVTDVQLIEVPRGSSVLSVQVQNSVPCIWYVVPDTETKETDKIQLMIFGTGNPIGENIYSYDIRFIGTFQMHDGQLVLHLFGKVINY